MTTTAKGRSPRDGVSYRHVTTQDGRTLMLNRYPNGAKVIYQSAPEWAGVRCLRIKHYSRLLKGA